MITWPLRFLVRNSSRKKKEWKKYQWQPYIWFRLQETVIVDKNTHMYKEEKNRKQTAHMWDLEYAEIKKRSNNDKYSYKISYIKKSCPTIKKTGRKKMTHSDKTLNLQKSTVRKQENKQTNNDNHPHETLNLQKSNPVVIKGKERKKERKPTITIHKRPYIHTKKEKENGVQSPGWKFRVRHHSRFFQEPSRLWYRFPFHFSPFRYPSRHPAIHLRRPSSITGAFLQRFWCCKDHPHLFSFFAVFILVYYLFVWW